MRRLIGALAMSAGLGLCGCGGGEEPRKAAPPPPPPPPTAKATMPPTTVPDPGTPLGVSECDDYLSRFEACVPKFPSDQQSAVRTGITTLRAAFRQQITTPDGRTQAVDTCKKLTEQLAQNPTCK
jgi:hypothetical protein